MTDWSLLSAELEFIYIDPVLAAHLEQQADTLVGKSLLMFVHPDEVQSAKNDLHAVIESRAIHGSVTRYFAQICVYYKLLTLRPVSVRFSRLSRVRNQLGYPGRPEIPWSDAEKVTVDPDYMVVDVVINWAADGLVLCFMHAVVDIHPQEDNDEQRKNGWSNWCGTPELARTQRELLFDRLLMCLPHSREPENIFQILANTPERPLLLSWPPDQASGSSPAARDFARLAENVQMNTNATDAKTSCTRRYKSLQDCSGVVGKVESIFIPHGECERLVT